MEYTVNNKEEGSILLDETEQTKIKNVIQQNQVIVFSKSYCPYCRQAKMALNSIINLDYTVIEMDDGDHNGWQAYVAELAKIKAIPTVVHNNTKSVPQIFINQQYIGGAEDLADLFANKGIEEMLGLSV